MVTRKKMSFCLTDKLLLALYMVLGCLKWLVHLFPSTKTRKKYTLKFQVCLKTRTYGICSSDWPANKLCFLEFSLPLNCSCTVTVAQCEGDPPYYVVLPALHVYATIIEYFITRLVHQCIVMLIEIISTVELEIFILEKVSTFCHLLS